MKEYVVEIFCSSKMIYVLYIIFVILYSHFSSGKWPRCKLHVANFSVGTVRFEIELMTE